MHPARRPPLRTPDVSLSPSNALEPAMLISALSQLERELTPPLEQLRENLIRKLNESPEPAASALGGACRPATLVDLCEELVAMTRVFFDDAAVREHALAPRPGRGLDLSTLIDEIDQRFSALAQQRDLTWQCRVEGPDARLDGDPLWTRQAVGRAVSETLALASPGSGVTVSADLSGAEATIRITLKGPSRPIANRLESEEPEHRALAFARVLLEHLGGSLEPETETDSSSGLVLRLSASPR